MRQAQRKAATIYNATPHNFVTARAIVLDLSVEMIHQNLRPNVR